MFLLYSKGFSNALHAFSQNSLTFNILALFLNNSLLAGKLNNNLRLFVG